MTYDKQYSWQKQDEIKGWNVQDVPSDMHKVKIVENESGRNEEKWFNFTVDQSESGRWKKHVDQWVERIKQIE